MHLKTIGRWRWEIALAGCVLVSVGVLVVSESGHRRLQAGYTSAIESMWATARHSELLANVLSAETAQRGFLLTRREAYLEPYNAALPRIQQYIGELRKYYGDINDTQGQQALGEVATLMGEKLAELELTISMAQAGKWTSASEIINSDLGIKKLDEIRTRISNLQQRERERTFNLVGLWRNSLNISRVGVALVTALNIVLLLLIFRWLARDWQRAADVQEALDRTVRERTSQLETLASHLQDVSETEKSRLARELHDELGAILTASKMDIAWVRGKLSAADTSLAEKLERAIKHLEQGIQTKRRIIEDLRPTTLVTFGLTTGVREYAEQVREQAGWQLQLDLPGTEPDLPEQDTIALFRILQESLTNVSKYARASKVRISFTFDGTTAKLEVEDNGIGFRPRDTRPKAHGLLGMRQRINARGGSLEIRSEPGKGTLVCAVMPVRKSEQNDAISVDQIL